MIIKYIQLLLKIIESFFVFLFVYLIISFYGGMISTGDLQADGDYCIYVQSNGIHTDVCLPTVTEVIDWSTFVSKGPFSNEGSFEYITIGWGDKGFFLNTPTWAELKMSTALTAAFLPSETAMHVQYSKEPEVSELRVKVYINESDYKNLILFVKSSFKLKNEKIDLIRGKGYSKSDNFYEANNSYHLFHTCNSWTNNALKTAKIKTGVFALFPHGILSHL